MPTPVVFVPLIYLTDILRNEWGFEGLVVSDWNALNDRVQGIIALMAIQIIGKAY